MSYFIHSCFSLKSSCFLVCIENFLNWVEKLCAGLLNVAMQIGSYFHPFSLRTSIKSFFTRKERNKDAGNNKNIKIIHVSDGCREKKTSSTCSLQDNFHSAKTMISCSVFFFVAASRERAHDEVLFFKEGATGKIQNSKCETFHSQHNFCTTPCCFYFVFTLVLAPIHKLQCRKLRKKWVLNFFLNYCATIFFAFNPTSLSDDLTCESISFSVHTQKLEISYHHQTRIAANSEEILREKSCMKASRISILIHVLTFS